jgi:membrane-bound lytic murein transglycosylase D
LLLPERTGAPQEGSAVRTISYRVRSGDSLGKIAKKFHITQRQIVEWNHLDPNKVIRKGQKLTLMVDVTDAQ